MTPFPIPPSIPRLAGLLLALSTALLAGCSPRQDAGPDAALSGYAEADYLGLASPEAGRLQRLYVRRGERVAAGAPVFALAGRPPVTAPLDADVADIGYQVGERVPAGQPVASLLAPRRLRARFFAPRERLASFRLGQQVALSCDGCGAAIPARVSFVAREPEPNRPAPSPLYMLEAKPDGDTPGLRPGQPLQVRPLPRER